MAKYSMKMQGKEVGSAATYAPPHTMTGKATKVASNPGSLPDSSEPGNVNMTVGNINRRPAPAAKTSGIKIRGTGAATKGTMARGPMA